MSKKETLNNDPNIKHDETTKEEYIVKFIKALAAVEYAAEPFKEQKRDLKKSFDDNGWLSKEEQRMAVRAYRLLKDDDDPEQLMDFYSAIKAGVGK